MYTEAKWANHQWTSDKYINGINGRVGRNANIQPPRFTRLHPRAHLGVGRAYYSSPFELAFHSVIGWSYLLLWSTESLPGEDEICLTLASFG